MMRFAIAFLATAAAVAQQGAPLLVDAVVMDAAGKPVVDLSVGDFEIMSRGLARPLQGLNLFDNLRHTSSSKGAAPALPLTPDQIRRTTVVVVDDLCMSVAASKEIRTQLHQALKPMLEAGGRAAILRSSGGTSRARQLTNDSRQLADEVESIEFLGGDIPRGACAAAAWATVTHAAAGLEPYDGRKSVILMGGELPASMGAAGTQIARVASESATAIYQTAAGSQAITRSTGGESGIDLPHILQREASYYVLAFTPASPGDFSVTVRRPGVTVGTRGHTIRTAAHSDFPAPRTAGDIVDRAIRSPFDGQEIDVQVTPLFAELAKGGPGVDLLIHLDVHELTTLQEANGHFKMSVDVHVASIASSGITPAPTARSYSINLSKEEYARAKADGLLINMPLTIPTPGARQLRVVVADTASSRMGAATVFADVPDLRQGHFAISGLILDSGQAIREGPAVRVFHAGAKLKLVYTVYNATVDEAGGSQLETQTRIYAGGQTVFTGKLSDLAFPAAPNPKQRSVSASIDLDPKTVPGRYILHVRATDKLAGKPMTTGQYIEFTIE